MKIASYVRDIRIVLSLSLVSVGAGIGIQSCLAWLLLPEGRGQYAVCVVVFACLLTLTCALGQEVANVYYIGAKKLTPSQAMTQSLLMGVLTSAVACALGYFLTLTSLPFLNKAPLELFRFSLFCIPAMIFHAYLSMIFLGMREVSTFKYVTVAVQVLVLAGLGTLGAMQKLDVKAAILIQAGSNTTMALVSLALLRFRYDCRLVRLELGLLLRSLGYGLRYYFGKLATMVNVQIALIILSFSAVGTEQLGFFSAAVALTSKILLVPEAIQTAILPRVAADSEGQSRMVAQSIRLCLICCLVAVLGVFVLSRSIVTILLSPRFLPMLVPLWILLPGVLVRTISKVLPAYFSGTDRPQITSAAVAVTIAANLLLIRFLLPIWGLAGVALANSVAYTLEALLMGLAFQRCSGLPFSRLVRLTREDWNVLLQLWKRSWRRLSGRPFEVSKS